MFDQNSTQPSPFHFCVMLHDSDKLYHICVNFCNVSTVLASWSIAKCNLYQTTDIGVLDNAEFKSSYFGMIHLTDTCARHCWVWAHNSYRIWSTCFSVALHSSSYLTQLHKLYSRTPTDGHTLRMHHIRITSCSSSSVHFRAHAPGMAKLTIWWSGEMWSYACARQYWKSEWITFWLEFDWFTIFEVQLLSWM